MSFHWGKKRNKLSHVHGINVKKWLTLGVFFYHCYRFSPVSSVILKTL